MHADDDNLRMNAGFVFLTGLVVGVLCYLVAEFLTPKEVENPGDHDILLASRLGFIYTPVVGMWLGWAQQSWKRVFLGAAVGVCVGFAYRWLCDSRNFLAIMVGFPCLLGGVMAATIGSNRSPWLNGLGARLGKGLFAGLVLGIAYMITLNVVGAMVMSPYDDLVDSTSRYVAMMWKAGPIALGLAGGLFLILMRWAVGLTRVRVLVFEDVERQERPENAEQNDPLEPRSGAL